MVGGVFNVGKFPRHLREQVVQSELLPADEIQVDEIAFSSALSDCGNFHQPDVEHRGQRDVFTDHGVVQKRIRIGRIVTLGRDF